MPSEAFVLEPRDGKRIHVVGDDVVVEVSSRDTDGAFVIFEDRTPPLAGPPLHSHLHQDETWQVLEGQYRFEVDGQEIFAGPGATVFAPRGSVHTFQNIGTTPARAVIIAVPGGLDLFFEELEAAVPRGTAPDPAKIVPIFERHGLELHGPPLAARDAAVASAAD